MTRAQEPVAIHYFRCSDCGNSFHSEKKACSKCGSFNIEKKVSGGQGVVINSAIVYFPPKSHESLAPYTSVLLQMNENFRMFGIMEGEVKDLAEGNPLVAAGTDDKGETVFFRRP